MRSGLLDQQGLRWVEAAKRTLASASSDTTAMDKVKRWFAEGSTSAATLHATISTLQTGFKKMASSLNGNLIVITDMPQERGDPNNALTEALTNAEILRATGGTTGSLTKLAKNWN